MWRGCFGPRIETLDSSVAAFIEVGEVTPQVPGYRFAMIVADRRRVGRKAQAGREEADTFSTALARNWKNPCRRLTTPAGHVCAFAALRLQIVAGLIEALGGEAAIARELDVAPADVHTWVITGHIPPGWHLRLFGHASALGTSVGLKVFDLHIDAAAIGLSMLTNG